MSYGTVCFIRHIESYHVSAQGTRSMTAPSASSWRSSSRAPRSPSPAKRRPSRAGCEGTPPPSGPPRSSRGPYVRGSLLVAGGPPAGLREPGAPPSPPDPIGPMLAPSARRPSASLASLRPDRDPPRKPHRVRPSRGGVRGGGLRRGCGACTANSKAPSRKWLQTMATYACV